MRSITVLVVLMLTVRFAHAHADDAVARSLAPVKQRARSEMYAGIGLAVASAALALVGGIVGSQPGGENQPAGIGLGVAGAALVLPATFVSLDAAGRRAAVRAVELEGDAGLVRVDEHGHALVRAGVALVITGVVLFGGGLALALVGAGGISLADSGQGGNGMGGLLIPGIVISTLGDGAWLTGSCLWSYGSGVRHGVAETRGSIHLSATGLAGTF
jgi:hypothetical protein